MLTTAVTVQHISVIKHPVLYYKLWQYTFWSKETDAGCILLFQLVPILLLCINKQTEGKEFFSTEVYTNISPPSSLPLKILVQPKFSIPVVSTILWKQPVASAVDGCKIWVYTQLFIQENNLSSHVSSLQKNKNKNQDFTYPKGNLKAIYCSMHRKQLQPYSFQIVSSYVIN